MELKRWDIINHLIRKYQYTSYLEVGYYKGWSFDRVECNFKVAVDPNPSKTIEQEQLLPGEGMGFTLVEGDNKVRGGYIYKKTSDAFFSWIGEDKKYDIIFIDGLHESTQVDRDIQNALKHLSPDGTIVMHDCNPSTEEMTLGGTANGEWTGDVYKSFIHTTGLRNRYVVDTDYGVGVLRPSELEKEDMIQILNKTFPSLTWEEFDKFRDQFLDLISPDEFLQREERVFTNLPGLENTLVIPSKPHIVKENQIG